MLERGRLAWTTALISLFGALAFLVRRNGRRPTSTAPAAPAASPAPVLAPDRLASAAPAAAPPFGTLACLTLAVAIVIGGWWLYRQRTERIGDAAALAGGHAKHAPALLMRYGCASCHQISGVPASGGLVGPPLDGISARIYIAGVLPNTPDNLVQWIVDPRAVSPHTAMPVTGITPAEARDVAAYLYAR